MALAEEVVQEYKTSLLDLAVNSKPLINMLTIVAEENEQHAPQIVKAIEEHIYKCKSAKKLPVLYLIDSIMKNLQKSSYKSLFSENIVDVFSSVFEQVDEKTRASMYKLRQTWTAIVANQKLYMIDKRINNLMDPAWPITATPPEKTIMYINPKFLSRGDSDAASSSPMSPEVEEEEEEEEEENEETEALMRQQLIAKQQELLKLQQARLELELAEAQEKLSSKKKGKTHSTAPKAAATSTSMLSLPLPTEMEVDPVPEPVIAPSAPVARQPPATVRPRDPRLKRMDPKQSMPPQVPTVSSISGTFAGTIPPPHVGHVPSTQYIGHPVTAPIPGTAGLTGPIMPGPVIQQYDGMPSTGMMFPPQMGMPFPGQHPQEVFSGEVFTAEDNARFSDEKDSNDSDSSAQSVGTQQKSAINFRDPRFTRSARNPTEELKRNTAESSRARNQTEEVKRHTAESSRAPGHRNVHSHPQTSQSKTEHSSGGHERERDKSIKDRGKSHSPRKSSAPVPSSSSHRSVSREKDDKSEAKLKDFLEAEKRRTENEKKRAEEEKRRSSVPIKSNNRGRDSRSERDIKSGRRSDGDRNRGRSTSSRDRDRSPVKDKIPHQQTARNNNPDKGGRDPRKGRRSDETKERETRANRRDRVDTSSSKKLEDRAKPAASVNRGRSKNAASSQSKDSLVKTPPNKGVQKKEKRSGDDTDEMSTAAKKVKIEPQSEPVSTDRPIKVEPEAVEVAANVVKTEVVEKEQQMKDDLSDLFGAEDQDYRSAEQKTPPIASARSKGWDAFKASQPEQFKYDIELKKQRLEANRDVDVTMDIDRCEPQDIDYRVQRQDSSTSGHEEMHIPKELSADHHGEILIQAHKKLQEGEITVQQHQEVVRQLQELMHIQKLQEENRRLSTEMAPGKPDLPAGAAMMAPVPVEVVIPTSRDSNLQVEQRSPTRPLDNYKIPRKRDVEDPPTANRSRPYPEVAKEFDQPGQSRPERESRGPIDPHQKSENWREIDDDRLPHHPPVEFDRRRPARNMEWQRDHPHGEFDERGPPKQGYTPDSSEQRSRPQEFEQRGPHHHLDRRGPHQPDLDRDVRHPQEFDRRDPTSRDLDRRGHPSEDFRGLPPGRRDPAGHDFDQRVPHSGDIDRRVPPLHGPPSEEFDRKGLPQENFDRRGRPQHEFDRGGPAPQNLHSDFDRGRPHDNPARRGPPRDLERRPHPEEFERRGPPPAEYDHRGQPPENFGRGPTPANLERRPVEQHPERRRPPPENFDRLGPPVQEMESGPPEIEFHGRQRDPREEDFDGRGPPPLDRVNRVPPHTHPRLEAPQGRNTQPRQDSFPERPPRASLLGDGPDRPRDRPLDHGRIVGGEADSRRPVEGLRDGPDERSYFPGSTDGPPGRHPHNNRPQEYHKDHPEHRPYRERQGEFTDPGQPFEDRNVVNRPGDEPVDWREGPHNASFRPALLEHPRPFGPRGPIEANWRGQRPGGPGVVRPSMDLPMPSGSLPPSLREELEMDRRIAMEQERDSRGPGQRRGPDQNFEHEEQTEDASSTINPKEKEIDSTENISENSSNADSEKQMMESNEEEKIDPHGGLPPWKPVKKSQRNLKKNRGPLNKKNGKKKSPEPGADSKRTPSPPVSKSGEEMPKASPLRGFHGAISHPGMSGPQQLNEPEAQGSPRFDDPQNDVPQAGAPRDDPRRHDGRRQRNNPKQRGRHRDYPRKGGSQRDTWPGGPDFHDQRHDGSRLDPRQDGPFQGDRRQGRHQHAGSRPGGHPHDDPRHEGPRQDSPFRGDPQEGPRQDGSFHIDPRPEDSFHGDPRQEGRRRDGPFQGGPGPSGPRHLGPRPGGPGVIRPLLDLPMPGGLRPEGPRQDGPFNEDPRHGGPHDGPRSGAPPPHGPRPGGPQQEGQRLEGPFPGGPMQPGGPRFPGDFPVRPFSSGPSDQINQGPINQGPMIRGPVNPNEFQGGPRGPPPGMMLQGQPPAGPRFDGPRGPPARFPIGPMDRFRAPVPPQEKQDQAMESYIDKFGDPRFRCFSDMGPEVSEEVVLGKRNYEIKLGAPPRRIMWGSASIEVFADPSKRGVVIDGALLYKFGDKVKEVTIRGRREKIFYHGRPLSIWIDGQHFEARVDSPPKAFIVNGIPHKIQIDGRDMMILIDKEEKGKYGGEPRFVYIEDERKELRFDPPPRHIMIDGKMCELMLNTKQPCVNVEGKLHGIRFDGPPRDAFINGNLYRIYVDHAVKVRVGNRFHYIALGGPCHELIVDGRWFEVKFNEAPKEINLGNRVLEVRLPGNCPDVKILPEIMSQSMPMPIPQPGMVPVSMSMQGPPGLRMPQPGMRPNVPVSMFQPPGQVMPGTSLPPGAIPTMPGAIVMSRPPPTIVPGAPMSQPNVLTSQPSMTVTAPAPTPAPTTSSGLPFDISSLLTKLVSSGIIKNEPETKPAATAPPPPQPQPKPASKAAKKPADKKEAPKPPEFVNFSRKGPKVEKYDDIADMTNFNVAGMKMLQQGSIQRLYAGVQCTTCGVRFTLDDDDTTEKYRQHLDWHFRLNRRKDDQRVAKCRKWYYGLNDWLQYEEMGDTEDTTRSNFFEQQQQQQQAPSSGPAPTPQIALITVPEGSSVTKCPAATGNDKDDMCDICHEMFEQYWDEELEEWHLRDAIKVNNKTYHPICYEDYSDISDGTPTPSENIKEPDFSTQKSINYEESTTDSQAESSFVEVRGIADTTIPGLGLGTSTVRQSRYDTAVKTDVLEHVKTEPDSDIPDRVKAESDARVVLESIKKELVESNDQVPMDTEAVDVPELQAADNALIKNEPDSIGSEMATPAPVVDSVSEHLDDVKVKDEPVEEADQVIVSADDHVPACADKLVESAVEFVKTVKHEPSQAAEHECIETVQHESIGAIEHEPVKAVVHEAETVTEAVDAVKHEPVGAIENEPLETDVCDAVESVRHEPIEAVQHESGEAVPVSAVQEIGNVQEVAMEEITTVNEMKQDNIEQTDAVTTTDIYSGTRVPLTGAEGNDTSDSAQEDLVPVKVDTSRAAFVEGGSGDSCSTNQNMDTLEVAPCPADHVSHVTVPPTTSIPMESDEDIASETANISTICSVASSRSAIGSSFPMETDLDTASETTNINTISSVAFSRPSIVSSFPMETDLDTASETTNINTISSVAFSRPSIVSSFPMETDLDTASETTNISAISSVAFSRPSIVSSFPMETDLDTASETTNISAISSVAFSRPSIVSSFPMETDLDTASETTNISAISSVACSRSTIVSSLDKVKVAMPQGVLEISEEVLEISSNASTPTHDELPSPTSQT